MPKRNRHGQGAVLSEADSLKIRRHLRENPVHCLIWDIARWTGERWGAIMQLKIEDVYRDAARSIPHDYVTFRAQVRKATNGKRYTRQVPVHDTLREILEAYRPPMTGYLFPGSKPGKHLTLRAADLALRAAISKTELESKGYCTHSTRITFITNLHNCGISPRVIQQLTGHHDLKVLSRYIIVTEEQAKAAIAVL